MIKMTLETSRKSQTYNDVVPNSYLARYMTFENKFVGYTYMYLYVPFVFLPKFSANITLEPNMYLACNANRF